MANILYIAYDGMTDPLGQSQVLPYICGLSKAGYKFTLISCEKPERDTEENHKRIQAICDANGIDWHPLTYTKKPPILSTIKDVRAIKKKAFALHQSKKFELVHCRSYIPALIGRKLKRTFGIKFVFDMRGFWADERVDGDIWRLNNPIFKIVYNFFKKKEIQFFESADQVISLTENGKQEIHSWKTIRNNPIPIEVIPCCADMTVFDFHKIDETALNQLKEKTGIKSGIPVISYLGSVGTWYMANEMLDFFNTYKSKHQDAVFLFITPDSKEHIHSLCNAKNIDLKSVFVTSAQRHEVPLYASLSTFSLFFIKPAYSKKASSPTKQAELMGLGIPIICNHGVGDTSRIVEKYQSGIVVKDFNDEAYSEAINEMENHHFNKNDLRAGAIDYFDLELGVTRYRNIYQKLLTKN